MARTRTKPKPARKPNLKREVSEESAPPLMPPSESAARSYPITLRYRDRDAVQSFSFTTDDFSFFPVAEDWTYIVANRRRITSETRDALAAQLLGQLTELSSTNDAESLRQHISRMARADFVEVELPKGEGSGFVARAFPWEAAISLLTKPERGEHLITVLRHLPRDIPGTSNSLPSTVMVVRSGPGRLGEMFKLNEECRLVEETLQRFKAPASFADKILPEPDLETLRAAIVQGKPDVIHLAGVDPQALIWNKLADPRNEEGFVLRGLEPLYHDVDPMELAGAVCSSIDKAPHLVSISACFSASKVAPSIVAKGARYAIGFQDVITDADASLFFGTFYRIWGENPTEIHVAFRQALLQCQRRGRQAASAVLWSEDSFLTQATKAAVEKKAERKPTEVARAADLKVHAEPFKSINYSLLHNNRDVFEKLFVDKATAGELPPLRVEVSLEVGSTACRCRFSRPTPTEATTIPLAEYVRLPLIADVLRRCTESMRTNLNLRIECGDQLVCEEAYRVTILPADEWRDDGMDHCWLPSFVLPRDAAVLRVIASAQRYLRTLLDDCSAGFDGYQRVFQDQSNAAAVIDPQVQAIWAALQHELPLSYINPPPAYTSMSQRLRSPSQIFDGRAATCIDLALLFASCLEFIGVYPAVFLVTGHAFPAYWRSADAWGELLKFRKPTSAGRVAQNSIGGSTLSGNRGQVEAWMLTLANLPELLSFVESGALVPFESTHVTSALGFYQAVEVGPSLLHPETFDAMIDVQIARGSQVTPLPLINGGI